MSRLIANSLMATTLCWLAVVLNSVECVSGQSIHDKLSSAYDEVAAKCGRGDYRGAIIVADIALRDAASVIETDWRVIARLHNLRGTAHQQLDETASAAADYEAARDIYNGRSDALSRLNVAVANGNLGTLAEKDNRYVEALALYRKGLPELEAAARLPKADSSVVHAYVALLVDIASAEGKLGYFDESEKTFRKAIELYGPQSPPAGKVWSDLGGMLLHRGLIGDN